MTEGGSVATGRVDYGKIIGDSLSTVANGQNAVPLLIAALISAIPIIGFPFILALSMMGLKLARGESVSTNDIWPGTDRAIAALIAGILVLLAVIVGSILLVIPGLIAGFLFSQTFFVLADGETSPVEAMKKSLGIVKVNVVSVLIVLVIELVIFFVLGLIPVIGSIIAMAPCVVIGAFLYHRVLRQSAPGRAELPSADSI